MDRDDRGTQHNGTRATEDVEFRLVVRMSRESGWRASVFGPDATEREFVSPFELARFFAWPAAQVPPSPQGGIR
jgi:hypothetical protein